jgi:protease I
MQVSATTGVFGEAQKGRIGVLVEEHFDPTEFRRFNEAFPAAGYQVVYMSHLWGQPSLTFAANADDGTISEHVTVVTEVATADARDYAGIILIGAYAMDRLRYQMAPRKGEPNRAPAVEFLRRILAAPGVKIGTICHSLWLFCADPALLNGRRVTCAHNIVCDVENAGADVIFDAEGTVDLVIDGDLITGKHPGMIDSFLQAFLHEIEAQRTGQA